MTAQPLALRRREPIQKLEMSAGSWTLLPLRFHRLSDDRVLVTSLVGEHVFVTEDDLLSVVNGSCQNQSLLSELRAKHIIARPGEHLPAELLAMKLRTRMRRLPHSTALHMFVLTLRCEHTCRYCQVSRQATARTEFDMDRATAAKAVALVFRSPSPRLKIEFQGGEPLLHLNQLKWIVDEAKRVNEDHGKELAFVIATNLALIDEETIEFCRLQDIQISTSLDGPEDLHNRNRRRPGRDSWQKTVDGIRLVQDRLGPQNISALMTTTEASLTRVQDIIDTYVSLGLNSIFLRPISPYGFATRSRGGAGYAAARWLEFYREGLDYVIELNRRGIAIVEIYAAIAAKKIFTNDDPGYVDLTSPAGIGIGGLVYNYDGAVYASDEGRMLAEMKDDTFRLGTVDDSYEHILMSDQLIGPLEASITTSAPMCSTCAFEPFCGSDPVYHHATQGDALGHKAFSDFCSRNMGIFTILLERSRDDPFARRLFRQWASQ